MVSALHLLIDWTASHLPRMNQDVLTGALPWELMASSIGVRIAGLPAPSQIETGDVMPLLTVLGLIGSSVERHAQQAQRAAGRRVYVGQGLYTLRARGVPFVVYFGQVADLIGHPHRDTFVSYVEHNGPRVQVLHPETGRAVAGLPAGTAEGRYLLFSGKPAESEFIRLLRRCTCLQAAANRFLEELVSAPRLDTVEAARSAWMSAVEMFAIRAQLVDFMRSSGFSEDFFLDVLRQYAVPWSEERPLRAPSGANDGAALLRDALLFDELLPAADGFPGFRAHVRSVCTVLMPDLVGKLSRALAGPSLEARLSELLPVSMAALEQLSDGEARELLAEKPWLAAYGLLYQAQRDISRAHYGTILKYLVRPKEIRDARRDPRESITVVTNSLGTTHMNPHGLLKQLDDVRARHPLARFASRESLAIPLRSALLRLGYRPLSHVQLLRLCQIDEPTSVASAAAWDEQGGGEDSMKPACSGVVLREREHDAESPGARRFA